MPSEKKIQRGNIIDLIRRFAKEYRRELGKVPGEIIIVGGASIMMNYKFRDATQDIDAIMRTVSGISDVIARFAEENDLPADWINSDFIKTSSYSSKLYAVSKHFCFLNNDTLEIRTVTGVHLIAMKARAHREYRNDVSDIIGIMIEERMAGTKIDYSDISEAYQYLYGENIDPELKQILSAIAEKDVEELEKEYRERKELETQVNSKMVTYVENGVKINAENADTVIARIKEKQAGKR